MDEYVEVTWGEEVISPRQYQSFRVGPFSMRTKVQSNETPEDAIRRALNTLEMMARLHYAAKLKAFNEHSSNASSRT